MAEPVLMSPWIPVFAAFGGSAITGIVNYLINLSNKKSEEKTHTQRLLFNAAIENWKQACTLAMERTPPGKKSIIFPVESFIINMFKFSEIVFDKNLTKDTIPQKLKELREISDTVKKTYEDLDLNK